MNKVTINLEAQAIIPTLDVYKHYFDTKYPCENDNNDGSNMSKEDEIKYATYSYLLKIYEKSKEIFVLEYNKFKKKIAALEVS